MIRMIDTGGEKCVKTGGHLPYWKNLSTGLRRETDISFPLTAAVLSERKTYCKVEGKVA